MRGKEWRVVSERVAGTFRVFGDDEATARRELVRRNDRGQLVCLGNDSIGPYRLEWRPLGTQGNDSAWTRDVRETVTA